MRPVIAAAAGLAAVLALASCSKKNAETQAPAETVFAVAVAVAERGDIAEYLRLSGDLVASSSVDAYSDASGKITRLFVGLGSRVEKDEAIAEVDPSRPGMSYLPSVVKSPIPGTIVSLTAEIGETIAPSVPLAKIARTDNLELRTYVAERFISKMRVGLKAEVELEAVPGTIFDAVVKELNPVIDPSSRTMELRLAVSDKGKRLKSGMFAKVRIRTAESKDVVTIPDEAVVRRSGESLAFLVVADPADPARTVARRVPIHIGIESEGRAEIRSGISPGDRVVVKGQTLLDDGVRVNVVTTPSSAQ